MDKTSARIALHHRILGAMYAWHLDLLGQDLKEKNGWTVESGRDAIFLYLAKKYGWTIEQCQAMHDDALRVSVAEELKSWKQPDYLDELYAPFLSVLDRSRTK